MKKFVRIWLSVFIVLLGTGCWSAHEIEDLGLVSMVGVDWKDGVYELTIQLIQPSAVGSPNSGGASGSGPPSITISSSGATIFDAVRNALAFSSKRLYWGYCQAAILGEESLEKGLACLTDFFIRDYEVRPIIWIAVTGGKASDLLKAKVSLNAIAGEGLNSLFKAQDALGKCVHSMLKDVIVRLGNEGQDFACTLLGTREVENEKLIDIKGTALFSGEKFIGTINTLDSRGLLWLKGDIKGGIIVIKNQMIEETALEILSGSSKIRPRVKNGEVSFDVKIKVSASVGEQTGSIDPTQPEIWKKLEESMVQHIEKEAKDTLTILRELGVDPLGFGKLLRAYHPSIWYKMRENWSEFLRDVPVNIKVEGTLRNSGVILANVSIHGDKEGQYSDQN